MAAFAKRDMGCRVYHETVDGKQYPPEVLQAWVLNKLRCDAIQQIGDFQKVVITVPAYFDEVRRKATQDAGYMAGCEVLDIINEPTAAAVAYGFQQGYLDATRSTDQPRLILVYDLGGGTFDVTVMEIRGSEFMALSTDGDMALGGYDWDQRLRRHRRRGVSAGARRSTCAPGPRRDGQALAGMRRRQADAFRPAQGPDRRASSRARAAALEISREQFEEATLDLLDRTRFTCVQALRAAGLDWSDLERVLLVGGSTRMPMVRAMLQQVSGKAPDASVAADEAVAHGAALHAGLILAKSDGRPASFSIRNVNSHSLGVLGIDPQHPTPAQRHPHSPQHAAAGHGQARVQDGQGGPAFDPRADRRRRESCRRGLHAHRPLFGAASPEGLPAS